jgi:hypothetical protein
MLDGGWLRSALATWFAERDPGGQVLASTRLSRFGLPKSVDSGPGSDRMRRA